MTVPVLPTGQVAIEAEVIPFKKVEPVPSITAVEEVLALLDRFRAQVEAGTVIPRHLIMCVVEHVGAERERSYALSTGMGRMEMVGNLFALATEITMEPS